MNKEKNYKRRAIFYLLVSLCFMISWSLSKFEELLFGVFFLFSFKDFISTWVNYKREKQKKGGKLFE